MNNNACFQPNWASAPGETILDVLQERNISIESFAKSLNFTLNEANELLDGKIQITNYIANQLQKFLGSTISFWINRELNYRKDLERLNNIIESIDNSWFEKLPVKDLISNRLISNVPSQFDRIIECLSFFGVKDYQQWQEKYKNCYNSVAYRSSKTLNFDEISTTAWLRSGEVIASKINTKPWDPEQLKTKLSEIRTLTLENEPKVFIPRLQEICAQCGVAVVVVKNFEGCRASGASWVIESSKRILMLSFRHLSNDHFWFTFFHEIGHLLLHDDFFIESDNNPEIDSKEIEANNFARDIIIPLEFRTEYEGMNLANPYKVIMKFAKKIKVNPGIILGQLQYDQRIKHGHFEKLKVRYSWDDIPIL